MRILILKSNTACLENINPKSPASSGRFDVVLDFVLECLYNDREVRKDTIIYIVLSGCSRERILVFKGEYMPYLESEDELLKMILRKEVEIIEDNFEGLLSMLMKKNVRLFCLFEEGADIEKVKPPCDNVGFIIGDQDGFKREDLLIMKRLGVEFVSIGPLPYLSWFCCVLVNYYLDSKCRDV
ncbi:MAG: hypothetical protein GXO10_02470 [Crenarchaeota archaeon]|nr:hypothetical protein [Thermoproteota archaeon]